MCICVNKSLTIKNAMVRYQISEHINQSTESTEISERKQS